MFFGEDLSFKRVRFVGSQLWIERDDNLISVISQEVRVYNLNKQLKSKCQVEYVHLFYTTFSSSGKTRKALKGEIESICVGWWELSCGGIISLEVYLPSCGSVAVQQKRSFFTFIYAYFHSNKYRLPVTTRQYLDGWIGGYRLWCYFSQQVTKNEQNELEIF